MFFLNRCFRILSYFFLLLFSCFCINFISATSEEENKSSTVFMRSVIDLEDNNSLCDNLNIKTAHTNFESHTLYPNFLKEKRGIKAQKNELLYYDCSVFFDNKRIEERAPIVVVSVISSILDTSREQKNNLIDNGTLEFYNKGKENHDNSELF